MSTFMMVKHMFKADKAASAATWFGEMGKRMGEKHPSMTGADDGSHVEKGVWNHIFAPTVGAQAGGDIYCLWEFQNSKFASDDAMQEFLDSDMGPGFGLDVMNNCMYKLQGNPLSSGLGKFTDAGASDAKAAMGHGPANGSTWYFCEHHHKTAKTADEWWKGMDMSKMPEQHKAWNADGFANPSFAATGGAGKMICLWECKEGKTVSDLQKLLDGPTVGNGKLLNTPMKIDLGIIGNNLPCTSAF